MATDISIIVPAHREGRIAHPTMQSLFRAVDHAQQQGLSTEIIAVLDQPARGTRQVFERVAPPVRLEEVNFRDPGLSRNHGVAQATGEVIFFLDADDLFCRNWLVKGYQALEAEPDKTLCHTEYCVVFDSQASFWQKYSSTSPEFAAAALLENNCWDIGCAAAKRLLLRYPFQPTGETSGFGYEDWHLYCETLAAGISHQVVPETAYFARRKAAGSQLARSNQAHHLLRPTKLFQPNNAV